MPVKLFKYVPSDISKPNRRQPKVWQDFIENCYIQGFDYKLELLDVYSSKSHVFIVLKMSDFE